MITQITYNIISSSLIENEFFFYGKRNKFLTQNQE